MKISHLISMYYLHIPSAVIQPIRLAGEDMARESYNGQGALIVGWGTNSEHEQTSTHLNFGILPVISLSSCREYNWNVDETHLCTAPKTGSDTCQ